MSTVCQPLQQKLIINRWSQSSRKNLNDMSLRIQRMMMKHQRYDFELIYTQGKYIVLADALSRPGLGLPGHQYQAAARSQASQQKMLKHMSTWWQLSFQHLMWCRSELHRKRQRTLCSRKWSTILTQVGQKEAGRSTSRPERGKGDRTGLFSLSPFAKTCCVVSMRDTSA